MTKYVPNGEHMTKKQIRYYEWYSAFETHVISAMLKDYTQSLEDHKTATSSQLTKAQYENYSARINTINMILRDRSEMFNINKLGN
jgi:hypothetical protein